MTKREAAKILFFEGIPQNQIASLLNVSEKSLSSWKKKGEWDDKRTERALARETAGERLWRIINHNLEVIEHEIDTAKEQGIKIKADKGDVDALYKMMAAVKGHQASWTHYVRIVREFVNHIQLLDLHLSKDLLVHADKFLNDKRKELTS